MFYPYFPGIEVNIKCEKKWPTLTFENYENHTKLKNFNCFNDHKTFQQFFLENFRCKQQNILLEIIDFQFSTLNTHTHTHTNTRSHRHRHRLTHTHTHKTHKYTIHIKHRKDNCNWFCVYELIFWSWFLGIDIKQSYSYLTPYYTITVEFLLWLAWYYLLILLSIINFKNHNFTRIC